MKETPLSSCEYASVFSQLNKGIRSDGRDFHEMRPLQIHFGKDYGSCTAILGNTRVIAQVTCEVVEPRPSRPNEGKVSISVHLSPMAASHFEQGKGNDLVDQIQQVLDRNIKESKCIDTEALCILAEESVWQLKLDVTILNHDGNLGDACNMAGVAAIRHFHRPDVTVEEDKRITIHTQDEKEFIPTFLKKIPICLTFVFFSDEDSCFMVMDPTSLEERVMSGKLVVGLNPHGEITSLVFPGKVQLEKRQIQNCIKHAFSSAKSAADMIMYLVESDLDKRKSNPRSSGYLNVLHSDASHTKMMINERISGLRVAKVSALIESQRREEVELEKPECMDDDSEDEFNPEDIGKTLSQLRGGVEEKKVDLNPSVSSASDSEEEVVKMTADDME